MLEQEGYEPGCIHDNHDRSSRFARHDELLAMVAMSGVAYNTADNTTSAAAAAAAAAADDDDDA